ncbi:BTAD domain-containing putative transcriptional regulator [Actinoplanes sp. NBRC 103695]|uniref:BTAD domain-containing putative transcriptional regulator n=1 Tax=Actinoplanes sp. NBRC 103695 TaxID=3032202 RepID=UPI0025539928|nr:BTAD domain-containing putative transcriptional regulator [Actinoplanes sp. NBRC 103695]
MDGRTEEDLGLLLREARQALGLTQSELAARAGLSTGAVRDLEQGRSSRPRVTSVRALAGVLGLESSHRLLRLASRPGPGPAPATGPPHVSVLGPLAVTRSSVPLAIGSGRHRIVLARLALTPGQPVSREELIGLLWGDDPPPSAANVLQTHVSRLRRILGPSALTLVSAGYRLQLGAGQLDLVAYRSRLDEGRAPAVDPRQAFDLLEDALDMWRGDAVAGDVAELCHDPLVTALTDERIEVTIRLARLGETLRRQPEVLPRLRNLAARHPWHESLHARLIRALAASGQQAAALQAYDDVRRRLADELGIDPSTELADARQAVLLRHAEAPRHRPASPGGPVRPWQAPAPPPDFTGRGDHLDQIEKVLRYAPATCVVSGMAGVGKTSLALRVAQRVRPDFPDGQLHIDLRGADRRPVSIAEALARFLRALGVDNREIPDDPAEAAALYRSVLSDRRILVILDNARNAAQIRPLLPGSGPGVVLVTSRNQCSDLDGAALFDLPVLDAREAVDMLAGPASRTRVAADRPAAEALIEACGRLPIAIRMIAGRLAARPALTLGDALSRLLDEQSRLDQLRVGDVAVTAGFELSYQDLAPRAARIFRSAALIPGKDFSAAAVAALLGEDQADVELVLDDLVRENLLQTVGARRYRYHDLLHLFARRAGATARDDTEAPARLGRLFEWYLSRTAAAVRLVYAEMVRLPVDVPVDPAGFEDTDAAMAWLDGELGNLVAAVAAAADGPHRARSWQLADQLRAYFFVRRDTVAWLATGNAGLAAAEAAGDDRAQAAMHQTLGQARWSAGRHDLALAAYQRGVDAAQRSGWLVGAAYGLHNLGLVQAQRGRTDEAFELYQRALTSGDGKEFDHIRAVTLNDLGTLCSEQGRLTDAATYFADALRINQGAARRPSAMANRGNLGMVLRQLGEYDVAREHFDVVLDHARRTGSPTGQMAMLDELSRLHGQRGEWSAAVADADEALRLAREFADPRSEAGILTTLGSALLGSRAITDARARFTDALELSRRMQLRYFEAQASIGLAEALVVDGDVEGARELAREGLEIARRNNYSALETEANAVVTGLIDRSPANRR